MSDHVYNLPGEVAAAISTNRHELMTMAINRVKKGAVLPQEEVIGLLEAFRDIVKMRAEDRQRIAVLESLARHLSDSAKGLVKTETHIRLLAEKLGSGQPLSQAEREVLGLGT